MADYFVLYEKCRRFEENLKNGTIEGYNGKLPDDILERFRKRVEGKRRLFDFAVTMKRVIDSNPPAEPTEMHREEWGEVLKVGGFDGNADFWRKVEDLFAAKDSPEVPMGSGGDEEIQKRYRDAVSSYNNMTGRPTVEWRNDMTAKFQDLIRSGKLTPAQRQEAEKMRKNVQLMGK